MEQCPYCKINVVDSPDAANGMKPYRERTDDGKLAGCSFCRGDGPEDYHNCDDNPPPVKIKLAKRHCRHYCGSKRCDRHWFNIGNWCQGSGFSKAEAEEIVRRYNNFPALLYLFEHLLTVATIDNPLLADKVCAVIRDANGWEPRSLQDTIQAIHQKYEDLGIPMERVIGDEA